MAGLDVVQIKSHIVQMHPSHNLVLCPDYFMPSGKCGLEMRLAETRPHQLG